MGKGKEKKTEKKERRKGKNGKRQIYKDEKEAFFLDIKIAISTRNTDP